jgi:pilus assembly protein Flp/PilA
VLRYFRNLFACRRQDNDRGASAVEYGLLVAGIAAVIVVVVLTLGGTIKNKFKDTSDCISSNGTSGCPSAGASPTPN